MPRTDRASRVMAAPPESVWAAPVLSMRIVPDADPRPAGPGRRLRLPGRGGRVRWIHPVAAHLQAVAPNAEFILWRRGHTAKARIHASDESVDPAAIEAMILAQVILLRELAK
jgi:hypothetical protein